MQNHTGLKEYIEVTNLGESGSFALSNRAGFNF